MATDQPTHSTGAMIALYPPAELAIMALPGGLTSAELHVTVAYVGKADQVDAARLHAAAEQVAVREPITARLSGHARFTGDPDGDVIVALVDSPQLEQLRCDLVDALTEQGIPVPAEHGYIAHMTLAYVAPGDEDPVGRLEPVEVTFGALSVVHGDDRTDLPLSGGLAGIAREAYATGWAASGGPMTDRVRAGCTAAVAMALAHRDDPGILEATLHIGHLEGVWAGIYERREDVHTSNQTSVHAAWKKLKLGRHAGEVVRRYRARVGLNEAEGDDWLAELMRQLADEGLTHDQIEQVRQNLHNALLTAAAEGQVGAVALSADQLGMVGFGFDLAFEHAYAALENSNLVGDPEANAWLDRLLGDQASEVGSILGRLTRDGASAADMETAVAGVLSGADSRALTLGIDVLTSRAMSQGALDLYRSENVEWVDFITAGDQRVCTDGPNCAAVEANSPYPLLQSPVPGLHPLCRCTLAATVPLPGDVIGRFLATEDEEGNTLDAVTRAEENRAKRAAARTRHAAIAAREPLARFAAELDQIRAFRGSAPWDSDLTRALTQRITQAADEGVDPELIGRVAAAAEAEDLYAMQRAVDEVATREGLVPIGRTGETVAFDPELHQPLVETTVFEDGQPVEIWRQGHQLVLDGDTIRLDRAVVIDGAPAAAEVPVNAAAYHLSLDGIEDLAQAVESGVEGTPIALTGGSVGKTELVTTRSGREVVHKGARTPNPARAKMQANSSQAASMLGRALDLNLPRIYRTEVDAVWMDYIEAPSVQKLWWLASGESEAAVDELAARLAIAIDSDQGVIAGLFDMMIANRDRNIGNWLLTEHDEFWLIDHDYAFGPMWVNGNIEPPMLVELEEGLFTTSTDGPFALHYFEGDLDSHESRWVENPLTQEDVAEIRRRLGLLAESFALIDRSDGLAYALRVLDAIEPYATGTRNLIA